MKKLFLLLLLLPLPALAASAPPLNISVDHGTSLTLSGPAASVFIANPDIADVQVMSPTSIMIFGKRTGETSFMATDVSGHTLAQRTIIVMQDLSDLRQELDAAIPGNKIKAVALPNGIVLTGEATDPGAVADAYKLAQRYIPASGGDIINRIKVVGSNQIHIRVRFAEVQRNVDNTIGIDWNAVANVGGGFAFGLFTGASFLGADGTTVTRTPNTTLSTPNDAIVGSYKGKHLSVASMLDALAQEGLVTMLAEPNLTAMSGETASFLAGGEFPIPIPQGNGTITIEFKKYGISLEFTPTLIGENRINLHVKPEVSELTQAGAIILDNITVPALTTRKAETTVEIGSGESFAIAGLLNNNQAQTVNKYPLLGDLPVLGALFRSDHFVNGQTELVVIITPYIVKPNGQTALALPTDGFAPPNEQERLLGLRYSSGDPNARHLSGDPISKAVPVPAPAPAVVGPTDVPGDASDTTTVTTTRTVAEPAVPMAAPVTSVAPVSAPIADVPIAPAVVAPTAPAASVAPVTPVTSAPVSLAPHPFVPARKSSSAPAAPAPTGPGGFIME